MLFSYPLRLKLIIMENTYDQDDDHLFEILPSPEYNKVVKAYVVNGTIDVEGIKYKVSNTKDTAYMVSVVLFPDGTAEVINQKKF